MLSAEFAYETKTALKDKTYETKQNRTKRNISSPLSPSHPTTAGKKEQESVGSRGVRGQSHPLSPVHAGKQKGEL